MKDSSLYNVCAKWYQLYRQMQPWLHDALTHCCNWPCCRLPDKPRGPPRTEEMAPSSGTSPQERKYDNFCWKSVDVCSIIAPASCAPTKIVASRCSDPHVAALQCSALSYHPYWDDYNSRYSGTCVDGLLIRQGLLCGRGFLSTWCAHCRYAFWGGVDNTAYCRVLLGEFLTADWW